MLLRKICLTLALFCIARTGLAASLLNDGDIVALCGDSITEQKLYSVFIEDYLLMCQPKKVQVMQFGWSGETATGFANRMKKDVLMFKPTFATLCYGMNDGAYRPIDDTIRQKYRDSMTKTVDMFVEAGARVLVGSPGVVDTETFKRPNATAVVYNASLFALGQEGKAIAEAKAQSFVDIHTPMIAAMKAAKAKLGDKYAVAGSDGVHPGPNGHLVMAYGFLKGMNFDGEIGTFIVDLGTQTATTKGEHRIVKVENGEVTIESKRYPFCIVGDPEAPHAAGKIAEFVPFHKDLNRLMLQVDGKAASYKVTWGEATKEFTADQLKAGVNLAAEFPQNPFTEPFKEVEQKIREKQIAETKLFKGLIHSLNAGRELLNSDAAVDEMIATVKARHAALTAGVSDAVKPVTHTIKIESVQ